MSPYRVNALLPREPKRPASIRETLRIAATRLCRRLIVWWAGAFVERYPAKCPECGRRSHDPHLYRSPSAPRCDSFLMNYYRCGHKGDMAGHVLWG